MSVNPIPENHEGFIPYLIVKNAKEAIDFYAKAFGGEKGVVLEMQGGAVGHAEILVGKTRIMLAEEMAEWNVKGAASMGGCPVTLTIYVKDVDATFKQAVDAGMKVKKELQDQFYGDRMGTLTDPYGYDWCFGSKIEDVSVEEIKERMKKMYG